MKRIPWTLVVFAAGLVVPWLGSRFYTFLATDIVILALFAMSLNLLLGNTGLVSFGHAAYFGIGAYICAHPDEERYGVPFLPRLPGRRRSWRPLFALVFGFFCVRLTTHLLRHADARLRADRLGHLLQMERRHRRRAGTAERAVSRDGLDGRASHASGTFGSPITSISSCSSSWRCALPRSGASSIRPSAAC